MPWCASLYDFLYGYEFYLQVLEVVRIWAHKFTLVQCTIHKQTIRVRGRLRS